MILSKQRQKQNENGQWKENQLQENQSIGN